MELFHIRKHGKEHNLFFLDPCLDNGGQYNDSNEVKYEQYSIYNNELVKYSPKYDNRKSLKKLINIYHGPNNSIGNGYYDLSKKWYDDNKNSNKMKILKRSIHNYYKNISKAKNHEWLWTTFTKYQTYLKSKGYLSEVKNDSDEININPKDKVFLACNARATNEYQDKSVLAYCINKFMQPMIKEYFKQFNIEIDEDLVAVSELIQWIYRSQIRKGKPIKIYIPSSRMRSLLIDWLNGEI